MKSPRFWLSKEVFLGLAFVILITAPVFVFGSSKTVFVDKEAKGSEDGSSAHPYHSISKALKNADSGTEVFIAKGRYEENITLPKGVKLIGKKKDRGDVVIEADNNDRPTIVMKHKSEIDHLTVKGGRHGVRVEEDSKAIIYDVLVKDSKRDGIHIDSASRDKKFQVSISKSSIRNNDRTGIFSEKRNIVVMDSDIISNGSDGIDLAAGTKAWLEDNRFNDNHGSGARFVVDGSNVWNKSNGFRRNDREGAEVNSFGLPGTVGFKKTAFIDNGRYGIAKVARNIAGLKNFSVSLGDGVNVNRLEQNHSGSFSPLVRGF